MSLWVLFNFPQIKPLNPTLKCLQSNKILCFPKKEPVIRLAVHLSASRVRVVVWAETRLALTAVTSLVAEACLEKWGIWNGEPHRLLLLGSAPRELSFGNWSRSRADTCRRLTGWPQILLTQFGTLGIGIELETSHTETPGTRFSV